MLNSTHKIEQKQKKKKKGGDKDGKRVVSNKKDYLKWTSKPSYMSHKIFDNDLVEIRKNIVTLTLNKPAHIGMCILF